MAKVSIIIPIYNSEKYLEKCIDSVMGQTYDDFELLLIDDGSTDSSYDICKSYEEKDKRVILDRQENSGQGTARNRMIKKASGEYILFIDSDDYIDENLLTQTVSAAERTNADMVLFDIEAVYEDEEKVYTIFAELIPDRLMTKLDDKRLIISSPSPCNKLFKKCLFNDETCFPEGIWYEDLIAIEKIYYFTDSYYYIQKPFYKYLLRENSTMRNNNSLKTVTDRINAVNNIYEFYKNKNAIQEYEDEIEWVMIFHGFFLPCREIIHFNDFDSSYIKKLKINLKSVVKYPFRNKYYKSLSLKERVIFFMLYNGFSTILHKILKLENSRS